MKSPLLDAYLARLGSELRKYRLVDPRIDARIIEEVRGHLADATERGVQTGSSLEEAEREAISRFGSPEAVARSFALHDRPVLRPDGRLVIIVAVLVGLAIAYMDSRPRFDDAGITAGLMLISAGLLGLIAPQRPWLWALAIGIWIPAHAIARHHTLGSLAMLIVLLFPLAGAYAGMAMRRLLASI
jgi:hypothetical protein